MKLGPGKYFGSTVRRRDADGVILTLTRYEARQSQPSHAHANPTAFLLLSGKKRESSRHGEYDQLPFTFVFHPISEPHAVRTGPHGTLGLNIEWECRWLERCQLSAKGLGRYQFHNSIKAQLDGYRLLALAFQTGQQLTADLDTCLVELLERAVAAMPLEPFPCAPSWLRRAEDFIQANFRSPISLTVVATEVGMHPVYFARVFRRVYGCPVSTYIRSLRLVEAGRLILHQGYSLAEAACAAGFADQAHFCRCFRDQFPFTPKLLRKTRPLLLSQV